MLPVLQRAAGAVIAVFGACEGAAVSRREESGVPQVFPHAACVKGKKPRFMGKIGVEPWLYVAFAYYGRGGFFIRRKVCLIS